MLDLFGGKAREDKAQGEKVAETPQAQSDATGGLLADVKAKETPQRKSVKFKTAQGKDVEVSYIAVSNEAVEPALKQIAECILNGEMTPTPDTAEKKEV